MKFANKLVFGVALGALIMVQASYGADQTVTFKNQRGSTLTLRFQPGINNTGALVGSFTTAVGNCQADVGVPMPVAGFYNGNAIAVTVNFPHCKQVVAMTGNLVDGDKQL